MIKDRELLRSVLQEEEDREAFEADRPRPDEPADFTTAAAWRDFEARQADDRAAGPPHPTSTRSGREVVWLPWAAAVLLFVVSLALTWQVARLAKMETTLRTQLEEAAEPRANVPLVYLDAVVRSEGEEPVVSAEEGFFVLVVTPEAPEPFPEYRVEVTGEDDEMIREVRGLELSDHGTLRLGLSGLPAGEYRVMIQGLAESGEAEDVGVYGLRVR